jgi:Tfp pilus assembly protein PilF
MKRKQTRSRTQAHLDQQVSVPGKIFSGRRVAWMVWLAILGIGLAAWLAFRVNRDRDWSRQEELVQRAANVPGPVSGKSTKAAPRHGPGQEQEKELVERIRRANQLLAKGKADEAVELLKEAEKSSPDDEDVHYNLGIALATQGKTEAAVKEYEEALRIFPDYAEAHNNLGNLLLRMGQVIPALQHFEQAVKITPEFASAWNNFGTALQKLGRTNDAVGYFREAVRLNTNYWQARFNLGSSYAEQGHPAEARVEFQAVLRQQPGFAPAQAALTQLDQEQVLGPMTP